MKDYYKILNINTIASTGDIKTAYRYLVKKYHPDVNSAPDASDQFINIHEAYMILSDSNKRKAYNKLYKSFITQDDSRSENKDSYKHENQSEKYEFYKWVKYARKEAKKISNLPLERILSLIGKVGALTFFASMNVLTKVIIAIIGSMFLAGIVTIPIGLFCFYILWDGFKESQTDGVSFEKFINWIISE
jgi:curved DNA-binding protein CbpA